LDYVIGQPFFLRERHLGLNMLVDLRIAELVASLQSSPLRLVVARDDDDRAQPGVRLVLEEERRFVDHDFRPLGRELLRAYERERADARMGNIVQLGAGIGVFENNLPQPLAVDGLSGRMMSLPKALTISFHASLPGWTMTRARSSALMILAPNSRSIAVTVLFPVAIPPVKPTSFTVLLMAERRRACKKDVGFCAIAALICCREAQKHRRNVPRAGRALRRSAALPILFTRTMANDELARGARACAGARARSRGTRRRQGRSCRALFSESRRVVSRGLGEHLSRRIDGSGLRVEHAGAGGKHPSAFRVHRSLRRLGR